MLIWTKQQYRGRSIDIPVSWRITRHTSRTILWRACGFWLHALRISHHALRNTQHAYVEPKIVTMISRQTSRYYTGFGFEADYTGFCRGIRVRGCSHGVAYTTGIWQTADSRWQQLTHQLITNLVILTPCESGTRSYTQKTRHIYPMSDQCWPTVYDVGPTLARHWVDVWLLLG